MPVTFSEIAKTEEAERAAVRKRLVAEGRAAAASFDVRIGRAKIQGNCSRVEFTPLPSPIRLPAGSRELVYQIAGPSSDVRVEITGLCPKGKTTNRTCTEYSIRMGQPVPSRWTTTFACADKSPFSPGAYTLKAFTHGRLAKSISFTVR